MPSAETRRGRRIIGSIERGEELLNALAAVCRVHDVSSGEIRASGTLDSIELDVFDRATERHHPTRIGGGLELLSLHRLMRRRADDGALTTRAMLVRIADPALAVFGGQVRSAVVGAIDYVIESFDDVEQEAMTVPTVPTVPTAITLSPPSAPPILPPVAAPSQEEVWLAAGDVLVHPRFQRCLVVKVESNNEYIQVQLKNGRVVRLSLEVMSLSPRGVEDGQRIFHAVID
jgi:predicted DNA-binding protein with PD1-like motif